MMSGHGANPIFLNNKKKKIGRPEHSLTLYPLRPTASHFCLIPLPPVKVNVISVSHLIFLLLEKVVLLPNMAIQNT